MEQTIPTRKRHVTFAGILIACVIAAAPTGCGGDSPKPDGAVDGPDGGGGGGGGDGGKENPGAFCDDKAVGWKCGIGRVCNDDSDCVDGCYIDGTLYAIGEKSPANACDRCLSSAEPGWTRAEPGSTCGEGMVCDATGQCVAGCLIDGDLLAIGAVNPSNPCEICSAQSQTEWTSKTGSPCAAGKVCNSASTCVDGCYIGESLYAIGFENPSNPCEICSVESRQGGPPRQASLALMARCALLLASARAGATLKAHSIP